MPHSYRDDCYCLSCMRIRRQRAEQESQALADVEMVHQYSTVRRTRTLADLYRAGRSKGYLRSVKGYN